MSLHCSVGYGHVSTRSWTASKVFPEAETQSKLLLDAQAPLPLSVFSEKSRLPSMTVLKELYGLKPVINGLSHYETS